MRLLALEAPMLVLCVAKLKVKAGDMLLGSLIHGLAVNKS